MEDSFGHHGQLETHQAATPPDVSSVEPDRSRHIPLLFQSRPACDSESPDRSRHTPRLVIHTWYLSLPPLGVDSLAPAALGVESLAPTADHQHPSGQV